MEPGLRLRQDFASQQQLAMRGATRSEARKSLIGTIGGAVAGAITLSVMAASIGLDAAWYTFLLEVILTAFMGLVLTRVGGGLLKGAFLLPLAYGAGFALRGTGFDPGKWFAGPEVLVEGVPGLGHLIAVCGLLACGGLLGYVVESRST